MRLSPFLPLAGVFLLPWVSPFASSVPPEKSGTDPIAEEQYRTLEAGEDELLRLLPKETLLCIEAPGLASLLEAGPNADFVRALHANPAVRVLLNSADPSLEDLIEQGTEILQTPLVARVASLIEKGAALGVFPSEGKLTWAFVANGGNADDLRDSLKRALSLVGEKVGLPRAFNNPHDTINGADVWYLGEELCLARKGTVLVASATPAGLERILGKLNGAVVEPETSGERPVLRLRINSEAWRSRGLLRPHLDGVKQLNALRDSATQPAVQFLLGPMLALIGQSEELRVEVFIDGEELRIELGGEELEAGAFAALLPRGGDESAPLPPAPNLADGGAQLLVYRDIDALFAHRAELFPPSVLPSFAKAISDLTPFVGGLGFTEQFLPGLSPWMRVIVQPVMFDDGLRPAQPLPAACLLVELTDSERIGGSLVAGFQSAVAIVGIERAQNAKTPLLLGIELVDGIAMSKAHFLPPAAGDGVDIEYNLVPACAVVGSTFVIGTHKDLVARVVRDLVTNPQPEGTRSSTDESLKVGGDMLVSTFALNMDALVMSKMLDEGVTRKQAREELGVALGLLELLKELRIDVDHSDSQRVHVKLAVDLRKLGEPSSQADRLGEVSHEN